MTTPDPAIAELIREVLAEELARLRGGVRGEVARLRAGVREVPVRIDSDADLAAFAKRVLAVADDPEEREALEDGRLVFRLDGRGGRTGGDGGVETTAGGAPSGGAGASAQRGGGESGVLADASAAGSLRHGGPGHTESIERGLLSERHVDRLPRGTARVRLGRDVKLTPLARDRLRRRRIAIERDD